jgi:hypothetical protein
MYKTKIIGSQSQRNFFPVSSIYIWSENSSPKSEAKVAEIEELLDVNFRHLGFSFLIGPDIAPDIY